MLTHLRSISTNIFGKDDLTHIGSEDIDQVIAQYPYFSPARVLIARKKFEADGNNARELVTAALYLHNPLRLPRLLEPEDLPTAAAGEAEAAIAPAAGLAPAAQVEDAPLAFQSYHTIDYFASQGIRLQQAELGKDKLGQQLKSFTEWLRSMKKLPSSESELPGGQEDSSRHQHVLQSAAHSIEAKEVLTEAMAEVWAKQGNVGKASAIYEKLSLQNPAKSDYFAAKIARLKA